MISVIQDFFIEPLLQSYHQADRDQRRIPKSDSKIQDRVLWVLIWLWGTHSLNQFHEILFTTGTYLKSTDSLAKVIKNTASDLAEALRHQIKLPSEEEWLRHSDPSTIEGMEEYRNHLMMIIDGTSLPIMAPKLERTRQAMYVSYKSHYAWRYMIACLPSGKIVSLSELEEGKMLDSEMYVESRLKQILEQQYPNLNAQFKYVIVGDKGYVYIVPPEGWELLLTKSGESEIRSSPDGQTSRPSQGDPGEAGTFIRRFETSIARARSVVERSISVIKRWRRISTPCSIFKQGDRLNRDLVVIATAYANYLITRNLQ